MDWMHMTSHGAKRRKTSDNEPSQNKNKCIDLILSQPHDPQMLFFSSAAFTSEWIQKVVQNTQIKCTYCYMGDYFSTVSAIIYIQKWKVIWMRDKIMHYWDQCIIVFITVVRRTHWLINECRQDLTGEGQGETVVKDWGRLVINHSEQTTVKSILVTNRLLSFLKDPFLSISFIIEQSSGTLISQHTYNYNFHAMLFTMPYLFNIQVHMGFIPF